MAFTTNPVNGANELVINTGWGLGEALVSGQVDPDEITVRKSDRAILSTRAGAKGRGEPTTALSLAPAQIDALAELLIHVERNYGTPQDIEWCHDGRQFWIVQSRPVTTRVSPQSGIEWTRANLAEVLPDQLSAATRATSASVAVAGTTRPSGTQNPPASAARS